MKKKELGDWTKRFFFLVLQLLELCRRVEQRCRSAAPAPISKNTPRSALDRRAINGTENEQELQIRLSTLLIFFNQPSQPKSNLPLTL
jgi:hypothetical protein